MVPTYTFFAVDKGNMTLIQFSNGINMLIDCHSSESRPSPLEYLLAKIKTLDFVVITHPHQDHLTGLKDVCEKFKPRYLWHNGRCFRPDPVYDDWSYYEKLRAGNLSYCTPVKIQSSQTATIGDSRVYVAAPTVPNIEGTADDENNNGIILSIVTGNAKVVLTGDTEEPQWSAIDLKPLAKASVFLASHHGREDGFSDAALAVIKPQHIIISDGEAAETDATERYRKVAPVSTTREHSITLRPTQPATASVAS
jgi:competence protein ComEC